MIDEKGRIFGKVNIIDALVVVLLITVTGSGVLLVVSMTETGSPSAKPASDVQGNSQNSSTSIRYATIDIGVHPKYISQDITKSNLGVKNSSINTTDIYRIPTEKGVHIWVRVRLEGQIRDTTNTNSDAFIFEEKRIKPGSKINIYSRNQRFSGTTLDLDKQGKKLPGETQQVVIQTITSSEIVDRIQTGDRYTIGSNSVATIESASIYPTDSPRKKRVLLGILVKTLNTTGQSEYIGNPVQVGQRIPFRTGDYDITGKIIHKGGSELPGREVNTTIVVKLQNRNPEISDGISAGMVEMSDGRVRARILEKRVENSTVVLKSDTGNIYARQHPVKKDIYLTVQLVSRRTDAQLYFHNKQIREGKNITLDIGNMIIKGQVTSLQERSKNKASDREFDNRILIYSHDVQKRS